MKLTQLLNNFRQPELDAEITGLSLDSRAVMSGDAFFALPGANQHGLSHARQAILNGARAIIYDPQGAALTDVALINNVISIAIPELNCHVSAIAAEFYQHPAQRMTVIGITGTNGKTTCSQLIAQAIPNCGVIGTMGWGEPDHLTETLNTTPDALTIQKILKQFADQGKSTVAMEVSSHGLQQGRVNAVAFKGAVFTNLSRDHLDYHGDMDSYLQAKLALFSHKTLEFAVINLDDANSLKVLNMLAANVQIWTFSTTERRIPNAENLLVENISLSADGIHFDIRWREHQANAFTPLVGVFNLENVLAVLSVLLAMAVPFAEAVSRLQKLRPIPGRMEKFGEINQPRVFVDYAHSPDALEKVLKAVKGNGRLWVVFGCGGDRDKGKRPEMGKIASILADKIIVTDDNPRNEQSATIINDILAGCQNRNVTVINDRTLAIASAIQQAGKHDCVVIAGKGHENYQEINGKKLPFSDQEIVKQSLAEWSPNS